MKKYDAFIFSILAFACLLAIDQFTKDWAIATLASGPITPISQLPFFQFELAHNYGVAFGLPIPLPAILTINLLLLPAIIYFAHRELNLNSPLTQTALILLFAGAIGNITDRFLYGHVIDFIAIGPWPNFNFADTYIVTAVLMILLFYGRISGSKTKH